MPNDPEVRLVQAAHIAGESYLKMRDLVLRGVVRGRQDLAGRWWVVEKDVRRWARERSQRQGEPAGEAGAPEDLD